MKFELEQALSVLRNTPKVLHALLSGLGEAWTASNYGPNTFSPFDVVGHLIHGERTDWVPRARMILEHGTSQAFEPFDRYAMYEANKGKTIGELLDTFAELREANLAEVERLKLSEAQLALQGRHPELGLVSLENLLATWVVHDLNHLAQIAKAMSYQYKDAVGPWHAYLSILR